MHPWQASESSSISSPIATPRGIALGGHLPRATSSEDIMLGDELVAGEIEANTPLRIGDIIFLSAMRDSGVHTGHLHSQGFCDRRVGLVLRDSTGVANAPASAPAAAGEPPSAHGSVPLRHPGGAGGGVASAGAAVAAAARLPDPHRGGYNELAHFRDCLFRVTHCCQYVEAKRLQRMTRVQQFDKKNAAHAISARQAAEAGRGAGTRQRKPRYTLQQVEYVRERAEREREKNRALLEEPRSELVNYGRKIQLQHVLSGRFLSSVPKTHADVEIACIKLELQSAEDCSEDAWFRFEPRFSYRSQNQAVLASEQVMLVNERTGLAVHTNPARECRLDERFSRLEVNLSSVRVDGVSWRLSLYQSFKTDMRKYMPIGQPLRLFHAEAEAWVCASANTNVLKGPYLRVRKHRDLEHVSNFSSKHVFIIVGANSSRGGFVRWQQPYRLLHLASKRYLAVRAKTIARAPDFEAAAATFESVLVNPDEEDFATGTLFQLHPASARENTAKSEFVPIEQLQCRLEHRFDEEQAQQISERQHKIALSKMTQMAIGPGAQPSGLYSSGGEGGRRQSTYTYDSDEEVENPELFVAGQTGAWDRCWLHNTTLPKIKEVGTESSYRIRSSQTNLTLGFCTAKRDEDVLNVGGVAGKEVGDIQYLLSHFVLFDVYVHCWRTSSLPNSSQRHSMRLDRAVKRLCFALLELIRFLLQLQSGYSYSQVLGVDGTPHGCAQQMARELKVLDGLFWVLHYALAQIRSMSRSSSLSNPVAEKGRRQVEHLVLLLFKAIKSCFVGHSDNEVYVADRGFVSWQRQSPVREGLYIQFLLDQLDEHEDFAASQLLTALVTDNARLMHGEINNQTIAKFVQLLKVKGADPHLMGFLVGLCSCKQTAISHNQDELLRFIYSEGRKEECARNRLCLTIETAIDHDSVDIEKWSIPTDTKYPQDYLGRNLVDQAVHPIVISWHCDDDRSWKPGSQHLWHSPNAMGLSSRAIRSPVCLTDYFDKIRERHNRSTWVAAESLCWVLEPEALYPKVHATKKWAAFKSAMERNPVQEEQFFRMKQLALYYDAQIKLFSAMCYDRNYNCIPAIERQFTFELCLTAIVNENLPRQLRASFTNLMHALYIDRFPHAVIQAPNYAREYSHIRAVKVTSDGEVRYEGRSQNSVLPRFELAQDSPLRAHQERFVKFPDASKFFLFQNFMRLLLLSTQNSVIIEEKARNRFVLESLRVLRSLVRYGFYGSAAQMRQLCQPLLLALDGRKDVVTREEKLKSDSRSKAYKERKNTVHLRARKTSDWGRRRKGSMQANASPLKDGGGSRKAISKLISMKGSSKKIVAALASAPASTASSNADSSPPKRARIALQALKEHSVADDTANPIHHRVRRQLPPSSASARLTASAPTTVRTLTLQGAVKAVQRQNDTPAKRMERAQSVWGGLIHKSRAHSSFMSAKSTRSSLFNESPLSDEILVDVMSMMTQDAGDMLPVETKMAGIKATRTFSGNDATTYFEALAGHIQGLDVETFERADAIRLGQALLSGGYIQSVDERLDVFLDRAVRYAFCDMYDKSDADNSQRYTAVEGSTVVIDAKLELLGVLNLMSDFRAEFQLSRLLYLFKRGQTRSVRYRLCEYVEQDADELRHKQESQLRDIPGGLVNGGENAHSGAKRRRAAALAFLNRSSVTTGVIMMVVLCVVVSIWDAADEDHGFRKTVNGIQTFACAFFVSEVSLRMYGMGCNKFFRDKLCLLDLFVTLIDTVSVALELVIASQKESAGADSGGLASLLRICRFTRFVRMFRLVRYGSKFSKQILEVSWERTKVSAPVRLTQEGLRDVRKLFDDTHKTNHVLDLQQICPSMPFTSVCLDLMMYDDDNLFCAALGVLYREFSQKKEVFDALERVQLLEEGSRAELMYDVSCKRLLDLRYKIDSYECWGLHSTVNDLHDLDHRTARETKQILESMRYLCSMGGDKVDGNEPDIVMQNLFRKMGAHTVILRAAAIKFSVDESERVRLEPHLLEIKKLCIRFLEKFVWLNSTNQTLIMQHMQVLSDQIDEGVEYVPDLLCSLVKDNAVICQSISDDVLWEVAITLERSVFESAPQTRLLDFFVHVMTPLGQAIPTEQERIMNILISPKLRHVLLLFTEGMNVDDWTRVKSSIGYKRRRRAENEYEGAMTLSLSEQLSQAQQPSVPAPMPQLPFLRVINGIARERDQHDKESYKESSSMRTRRRASSTHARMHHDAQLLLYHVKLVKLLAVTCQGRRKATSCEAKCHSLLPLELVLTVLNDKRTSYLVKTAFAKFLTSAYVMTRMNEVGHRTAGSTDFWAYIGSCTAALSAAAEEDKKSSVTNRTNYLQHGVLPMLEAFLVHRFDSEEHANLFPAETESLRLCVLNANRHVSKFHHNLRPVIQSLYKAYVQVARSSSGDDGVTHDMMHGEDHEVPDGRLRGSSFSGSGMTSAELEGQELQTKMVDFIVAINENSRIQEDFSEDFDRLIECLLNVEFDTDPNDAAFKQKLAENPELEMLDRRSSAIPFTDLISRMIKYSRNVVKTRITVLAAQLAAKARKTDILMLTLKILTRCITRVVERYERVEREVADGLCNPEDLKVIKTELTDIQNQLCKEHAISLVVEVVSWDRTDDTTLSAMQLGSALLALGNRNVQTYILQCLDHGRNPRFFSQISHRIEREKQAARRRQEAILAAYNAVADPVASKDMSAAEFWQHEKLTKDGIGINDVMLLLQNICEGHNSSTQHMVRDQQSSLNHPTNHNLIEATVQLLVHHTQNEHILQCTELPQLKKVVAILDFLIETMQGPCAENQSLLAKGDMIDSCKSILACNFSSDYLEDAEIKLLQSKAMKALVSLLEGRSRLDRHVHEILSDKLETSVLRARLVDIYKGFMILKESMGPGDDETWDEQYLDEVCDLLTLVSALTDCAVDEQSGRFGKRMQPIILDKPTRDAFTNQSQFEMKMLEFSESRRYNFAYSFFTKKLRHIEVMWNGKLEKLLFLVPSECEYFTVELKSKVQAKIDFTSDSKVSDFLNGARELHDEMRLIEQLNRFNLFSWLNPHIPKVKSFCFYLAVTMNLIMLVSLEYGTMWSSTSPYHFRSKAAGMTRAFITVFGVLQVCSSSVVLAFNLVRKTPLVFKRRMRLRKKRSEDGEQARNRQRLRERDIGALRLTVRSALRFMNRYSVVLQALFYLCTLMWIAFLRWGAVPRVMRAAVAAYALIKLAQNLRTAWNESAESLAFNYCVAYDVLTDEHTFFFMIYVVMASLGLCLDAPFFFCFHLLDIVVINETLRNVVRAVTNSTKQLSMTVVLGIISIYIFAVIAFFFLQGVMINHDSGMNECQTLLSCFYTLLHFGLVSGGGVTEYIDYELGNHYLPQEGTQNFVANLIYGLAFFVIILILLLNIIFGIIIDQFGALRDRQNRNELARRNSCFICGLDRVQFDNAALKRGRPQGFISHLRDEHNMWDYLYYLVYLQHKSNVEYTGAESYLDKCIADENMEWVPTGTAMSLQEDLPSMRQRGRAELNAKWQQQVEEHMSRIDTTLQEVREQEDAAARRQQKGTKELHELVFRLGADFQHVRAQQTQEMGEQLAASLGQQLQQQMGAMRASQPQPQPSPQQPQPPQQQQQQQPPPPGQQQ